MHEELLIQEVMNNMREKIYPSFLKRIMVTCIDLVFLYVLYGLIELVLVVIISFLIGVVMGYLGLVDQHTFNVIVDNKTQELVDIISLISIVISIAIFSLFESGSWQSTLGKKFFKIIVTDIGGDRIVYRRALFRNSLKIITVLTFGIGYILILFTKQRQALHDKISNTLVLERK